MKIKKRKFLLPILLIALLSFLVAQVFIATKGKRIAIQDLQEVTGRKVTIASLQLIPPFNLLAKNIVIEDMAKVKSIFISPSIIGLLTGQLILNEIKITALECGFEKIAPAIDTAIQPEPAQPQPVQPTPPPTALPSPVSTKPQPKAAAKVIIKRLLVRDGVVRFIDKSMGQSEVNVTINKINVDITNLYTFPAPIITNIELHGQIPWQGEKIEGRIEAQGWVNIFKKDMQATLKVFDIDGVAFYPYYSSWVNLEKTRIQKAKLNFSSNIQGLNNEVVADSRLQLTEIVFKPRAAEEEQGRAEKIAYAVLDMFKALNKGNIILDFKYKTKLDQPKFSFSDIRMAVEDKISTARAASGVKAEDVVQLPGKLIGGTVKSFSDITRAVISGTAGIGQELKSALEGVLQKPQFPSQVQKDPSLELPQPVVTQPQPDATTHATKPKQEPAAQEKVEAQSQAPAQQPQQPQAQEPK